MQGIITPRYNYISNLDKLDYNSLLDMEVYRMLLRGTRLYRMGILRDYTMMSFRELDYWLMYMAGRL